MSHVAILNESIVEDELDLLCEDVLEKERARSSLQCVKIPINFKVVF